MDWVIITIIAAFLQNLRSILQKRLTGDLSVNGATYVRFCFALPFAWVYLATLWSGQAMPATTAAFWVWCLAGAVAQILGTACLLAAFTERSFAVSTALSKTETVQTALIGLVLLGDRIPLLPAVGIGVSLAGVLLLMSGVSLRVLVRDGRGLMLGLLAGTGIAAASVGFRGAALALPEGGVVMRAALTLAVALTLQTLIMGAYLRWREAGQIRRVAAAWRRGLGVGLCGAAASACWFTAMTIQSSALVRALGQVELLFALAASVWLFGERVRGRDLAGIGALLLGVYLLL